MGNGDRNDPAGVRGRGCRADPTLESVEAGNGRPALGAGPEGAGLQGRGPTHKSLGRWGCGMLALYQQQNGADADRSPASGGPFGTE